MRKWFSTTIIYGIKMFIMMFTSLIPPLIFIYYLGDNLMDSMHEFNLFFISIVATVFLMWIFSKLYKMPLKPEPINISRKRRMDWLQRIKWIKNHTFVSTSIFMIMFLLFFIPINYIWVILCSKGYFTSNFQALFILFIGACFLMIPTSIISAYYEGIVRPKEASIEEVESILDIIYSKYNRTRAYFNHVAKSNNVEPHTTLNKISMWMGIISLIFIQLAGYSIDRPYLLKTYAYIGSIFGVGMMVLIIISNVVGTKKNTLETFMDL